MSTENKNKTFYPDALLKVGFTPVANVLFQHRSALGISSNVLLLLVALLRHVRHKRFDCIKVPVSRLCDDTGFSASTLYRTTDKAEVLGILVVGRRENQINEYDLRPLFAKLEGAGAAVPPSSEGAATPAPRCSSLGTAPADREGGADILLRVKRNIASSQLTSMTYHDFAHGVPQTLVSAVLDGSPPDQMREGIQAVATAWERFEQTMKRGRHVG